MKRDGEHKPKLPLTPRDQKEFGRFLRRYGRPFIIHLAKTLSAKPGKGGREGTGLDRRSIAYFLWTHTKKHKAANPRGARDRAFRDLYQLMTGRDAKDDLDLYRDWKKRTMERRVRPYLSGYEREFEAKNRDLSVNPRHIAGLRRKNRKA